MDNVAGGVTGDVAIVGGGWAGCAAAVTLADARIPVTLYEAAPTLGGRARRVERDGLPLDNGQHLLLGAYHESLALMARVRGDAPARAAFVRRPLTLVPFSPALPDALMLIARAAPGRLGLLLGLLSARGLTLRERLANVAWFRVLERTGFARPAHETVATMLAQLPPRVARLLWEPLCLAALNTPVTSASAQVFANVLRAAFAGTGDASDFLLPATDLGALLPDHVPAYLAARHGRVELRVQAKIVAANAGEVTLAIDGDARSAAAAIISVGPHQLPPAFATEALARNPALIAALEVMQAMRYEPIATIWLGYAAVTPLPAPIARLDDAPCQWVVDRPDILMRAGPKPGRPPLAQMLACIVSASGPHVHLPHEELARAADAQLRRLQPALPACVWSFVITERRATYACTPGRPRPSGARLAPGLYLAGDYVDTEYPATIEAAVRSGITAARAVIADRLAGDA